MALNNFPFVKTNYIKTYATPPIEKNVDDNKVVPYIIEAQWRWLEPSLGSYFFNHLTSAGLASTLTSAEQTLIDDYIKPMLLYYVNAALLEDGASIITNKGVVERNATFATPMSQDRVTQLSTTRYSKAGDRRYKLVQYLYDNESLFPELDSGVIENIYRNFNTFHYPIYLDDRHYKDHCCNLWPSCNCRYTVL